MLKKQHTGRRSGIRGQTGNSQRKRKGLLWGLGRDPKRNTCVSEEQDQEGQLSRDTAKADKKENRTRAGRSLRLIWNSVRTVAGTGASHTET